MAGISFSERNPEIWIVAGWAFRSVLSDVLARFPDDSEIVQKLDEAGALGFLHVEFLEQPLAERVTRAIREVASGVLAGTIRPQIAGRFDEGTLVEYRKGLRMLLDAIPAVPEPAIARPRAS
jgi:hypothetical protein